MKKIIQRVVFVIAFLSTQIVLAGDVAYGDHGSHPERQGGEVISGTPTWDKLVGGTIDASGGTACCIKIDQTPSHYVPSVENGKYSKTTVKEEGDHRATVIQSVDVPHGYDDTKKIKINPFDK